MIRAACSVAVGAVIGALLRWALSERLNRLFPAIPPGTLVANLIGAYIIGLFLAAFATAENISPQWRLLFVTGFCGSLTTFSSFSAEVTTLLQHGRIGMAMCAITLHLAGSLLMTFAGIGTVYMVKNLF